MQRNSVTNKALRDQRGQMENIEHVARIRVKLPTSCPEGASFRAVALGLLLSGPMSRRDAHPPSRLPRQINPNG
jgi:hypothetical protein